MQSIEQAIYDRHVFLCQRIDLRSAFVTRFSGTKRDTKMISNFHSVIGSGVLLRVFGTYQMGGRSLLSKNRKTCFFKNLFKIAEDTEH